MRTLLFRCAVGPCKACLLSCSTLLIAAFLIADSSAEPIAVTEVPSEREVDFESDILPVLQKNCLACHNQSDAESDLVLESPETILKGGGEGPAMVVGKGVESLLVKLASHQLEPIMPPEDNDVGARNLTADELGLLKAWIDRGGKGSSSTVGSKVVWQPLPPGMNPVYAVDITQDGRTVAAGRANQLFLYDVPRRSLITRLVDPHLPDTHQGAAHLDLVQSIAFSPDRNWLASGGYRTVKLWRRDAESRVAMLYGLEQPTRAIALSQDGRFTAVGQSDGSIRLFDQRNLTEPSRLVAHDAAVESLGFSGGQLYSLAGGKLRMWNLETRQSTTVPVEGDVSAFAILLDDRAAVGFRDGQLCVVGCKDPAAAAVQLHGHNQTITTLLAVDGNRLLSGSLDGTVRLWSTSESKQLAQLDPGGPVQSLAAGEESGRIATVTDSGTIRLFDLNDAKQIAELNENPDLEFKRTVARLDERIAERHVENGEKDLKDARDRLKQEEDNAKKANDALKKADEELKQKTEDEKQKIAERDTAQEAVDEAKKKRQQAEQTLTAANQAFEAAKQAADESRQRLEQLQNSSKQAGEARVQANEALQQVQQQLTDDPQNQTLIDAVAAATDALKEADAKLAEANAGLDEARDASKLADTKRTEADQQKKEAEKPLNESTNAVKNAEEGLKQKQDPAKKANDARQAAEQTQKSSQRAVERAKESVEKAKAVIPDFERGVASAKLVHETRKSNTLQVQQAKKLPALVAFSSDGNTVLTAGHGRSIARWHAADGVASKPLVTQSNLVSLTVAANGHIVGATDDAALAIWQPNDHWRWYRTIGAPDASSRLADRVLTLAFSPDSKQLATGGGEPSRSGELMLWDVASGELIRSFPDSHSDTIFDVDFSHDGSKLATCGADRFMKVFDVATGVSDRSFEGHTHHVLGVSWRADDRVLATCGADQVVKLWDATNGSQIRSIQGFGKEVTAIQFAGVEDQFIASCGDKSLSMCNVGGGRNGIGSGGDFLYCARSSLDGKTIVLGGHDSVVKVVREDGQLIVEFKAD